MAQMTFVFICVIFLIIGLVSPEILHFCGPSYREALGYSLQLVTHKSSSGTQTITCATHTAYRTVQRDSLTYIDAGPCSDTTDSDHCFHS
jgi:hypothetical protein